MVGLGVLPSHIPYSEARGVTQDGSLVVGNGTVLNRRVALLWTERDGLRPVAVFLADLGVYAPGWTLTHAEAVSDDGRQVSIVGRGTNPNGDSEAWLAVVPSRPCDDGRDNDRDGLIDLEDPACLSPDGTSEERPSDVDGDDVPDLEDNCPDDPNPDQDDFDGDGEGDVCDDDIDDDGVPEEFDECPFSPFDEVPHPETGCSLQQLVPCEGPRDSAGPWRNHGHYVGAALRVAWHFLREGVITRSEFVEYVVEAARSECGRRDVRRHRPWREEKRAHPMSFRGPRH